MELKDIIDMIYGDRSYYAIVEEGQLLFVDESPSNVLLVDSSKIPKDFYDFVVSVLEKDKNKAVNGRSVFSRNINVDNNNFQDNTGNWLQLTKHLSSRVYKRLIEGVNKKFSLPLIQDNETFTSILSEAEPVYSKAQINRRVENPSGTFPIYHKVIHPIEGQGFLTGAVPGNIVKLAVETQSNLKLQERLTIMEHPEFTLLASNMDYKKDMPTINYDGGGSTKLNPDFSSWRTEEESTELLLNCKSLYDPTKQPPINSNLYQKALHWSGKDAQQGIESLKWRGWSDGEILALIANNAEKGSRKLKYEVVQELNDLINEIQSPEEEPSPFILRKLPSVLRRTHDILEGYSELGLQITQDEMGVIQKAFLLKDQIAGARHGFH